MLSWNVQLYCIREKKCRALHIISSYQRSKKRPTVTLSFSFKLHQLKHRWNIWWLTHITFKKRAYLLKNPPDLISIAFRIAEECCCQFSNPGYATSSFPAQPFSSASSQVLKMYTVNQQILAAIKFGVSQNKVIYVNLAAIKFGVSPRPVYVVYDRRICWRRQILAKTRNSPNSPNIIARQNLLIYSTEQSLKWVWWSQLLYSIRSCEQHMLSRDVQLHCVRNKKAFTCQKKSCETLHTVFILSKIQ